MDDQEAKAHFLRICCAKCEMCGSFEQLSRMELLSGYVSSGGKFEMLMCRFCYDQIYLKSVLVPGYD